VTRARQWWWIVALLGGALAACGRDDGPPVDPATRQAARAVEERVGGTFLDYYTEVVRLSRLYGAEPDSFRAALDSLPGSHLSDDDWAAWTAPYAGDLERLVDRLDEATAGLPPAGR
jgi:hypothetical protein